MDFNNTLELNSVHVQAYNNRGIVYHNLKNYDQALQSYTKAIQLNPKYAEAYLDRARLYLALGDSEKAAQDEESAAKLP